MKKALLLHHDFYRMFKLLNYEETGELIMAIFDYDINGVLAEFDDRLMMSCFLRMKDSIDTYNVKYEETCQKRIEAARKRWEKDGATVN